MRAAVVGAGLFGCTIAVDLARAGVEVDLFERRHDILLGASRANQGRLHAGYHYPRSLSTAREVRDAAPEFAARFPTVVGSTGPHHYLIAGDSRVSADKYLAFCDELQLPYRLVESPLVRADTVEATLRVEAESFVDLANLRGVLNRELRAAGVTVKTNTPVNPEGIASGYQWVVDATYGRTGWRPLLYEVCEIALVKLGEHYRGQSFVVMDGPFTSLDPLVGTNLHMLYDVVHSVHYVATEYAVEPAYVNLVDQGPKHTSLTRVDAMAQGARRFLNAQGMVDYQGSLFTVRAVLPFVDDTDERPTLVERDGNLIRVLSGKLVTAPRAARRVAEIVVAT